VRKEKVKKRVWIADFVEPENIEMSCQESRVSSSPIPDGGTESDMDGNETR
jgi:hypothetical protein